MNLLALQEETRVHKIVLSTPTGMVHLTDEIFDDIVMRGTGVVYMFCVDEIIVRKVTYGG